MRRSLSRRAFLGTAAAGLASLGAAAYGAESWTLSAPWPEADGHAHVPPDEAPLPDVPLVLLTNTGAQPDFGPYLAEILRAEGLVGWRNASLARLTPDALAGFATAILAPAPLNDEQAALLRSYVAGGGALVALRPDPRLADVFGVRHLGATAPGGYLRRTAAAPGRDPGPLQVHGPYDRLEPAGATVLATSAGGDPLVTSHRFGRGAAALWAFDLARCIALLRQGNPAWAGQERDGMEGLRASDLFAGWVDLERIAVPQADEHQRLLVAVLEELAPAGPPLPRLWYFPDAAPALVVATGDAHGSTVSYIERVLGAVEAVGGAMSIYYTPPAAGTAGRLARKARWAAAELPVVGGLLRRDDPLPAPSHVAAWRARGHEFGMHPYVEMGLEAGYSAYWNEFIKYGYGPLPPTVRTHRILWHGWVDNARVQARYGLRMNLDHYHSSEAVRRSDGTWVMGYLAGTGLPMRFVAEDGALLSVYQQPTQLVDEHMMNVFDTGHDMGLSGDEAAALTMAQIAASVSHYPAALGLQCHVDPFLLGGDKAAQVGRWLEQSLAYAAAHGVPILSAERWLAFTEARAATRATQLSWDPSRRTLTCELEAPSGAPGAVTLLLPDGHSGARLREVRIGGVAQPVRAQTLAGRDYTALSLPDGRQTIEADYGG